MKYHILHHFRTSTPFKDKSSNILKILHKMELLTNFDVSLMSFLRGGMNIEGLTYNLELFLELTSY